MVIEELLAGRPAGRHALDEDAVQTPIFAALTRGGWRARRPEPVASVEEFRRDPLTAPLPIQLPAPERLVTGGTIVDMTAGEARRAVRRTRAARERSAPREWAGLDALADTSRHHLRPVANW